MAIVKTKPTSPGRRHVVQVKSHGLHKGAPHSPLLAKKSKSGGRNNNGHITTRHRGGGHKQRYRVIDYKRDKDGVPGVVERLEYDPNRTAHIALIKYADGERRYIIAPAGISVGDPIRSGVEAPIVVGNSMALRNIPVGSTVHCIELKIGKGAQLARSAGGTTLCPRADAFHRRPFIDAHRLDLQFVYIGAFVVLRVGDGRIEHLLHHGCAFFLAESKNIQRLLDGKATNLISHQSAFLGRDMCIT